MNATSYVNDSSKGWMSDFGFRISDFGCRMLDFGFRISDFGWLGCRCWVETLWLGESVVRRGRPVKTDVGSRISDFGWRGCRCWLETLWLDERIVRRGRPGLTGKNPSDFSPWVF